MDTHETKAAALDMAQGATPYELARKLVQARERIAELDRALNTAKRDYEIMNKFREAAERERDELAAHIERMAAWIKEHGRHSDTCDILDLDEQGCHRACSCGLDMIDDPPVTSLARRDKLVAADALMGAIDAAEAEEDPEGHMWAMPEFREFVEERANRLRREAEATA